MKQATITITPVTLPKVWLKAAGLLKNKKVEPLKYQRQIREEWEKRLRKFERLAR